ncbi:TPA: hypothetical protein ANIA_11367 [Aspergillus nidulans FGSC A4]|uniref:Uncharacterized protein n=1 Tax=Emericella nidulans (strain FGSC A4 / ATCC 38163 / CBS 112.46 / NRRL 194 / M139) TaxID=227321 RepID=C8VJI6_EMENI|nr:TPA: hypothetical protein ANIA_11367 [Aspergillus nidulans FGSC A4]
MAAMMDGLSLSCRGDLQML